MPRPIWNGSITFGLLNIPVQLYSGERSVDLKFRMLDSRNKRPIRYERVNEETGEEVPWKDVVKAYEYTKGSYVVVDEDDIRKAAPEATETVQIEAFVDREAIDPRFYDRPYYLVPGKKAEKGYVLLRQILERSRKIGIAKVVIRTRQYLAALMPHEHALVLMLMRFPQELIATDEFQFPSTAQGKNRISEKELAMGEQLIESMSADWNPDDYRDDFREKLRKIIDREIAKQSGRKVKAVPVEEAPHSISSSNVVDFTALLKKSLEGKAAGGRVSRRKKPAAQRPQTG